jgi:hypothetical protein
MTDIIVCGGPTSRFLSLDPLQHHLKSTGSVLIKRVNKAEIIGPDFVREFVDRDTFFDSSTDRRVPPGEGSAR